MSCCILQSGATTPTVFSWLPPPPLHPSTAPKTTVLWLYGFFFKGWSAEQRRLERTKLSHFCFKVSIWLLDRRSRDCCIFGSWGNLFWPSSSLVALVGWLANNLQREREKKLSFFSLPPVMTDQRSWHLHVRFSCVPKDTYGLDYKEELNKHEEERGIIFTF